jgi:hypothetical protein
MTDEERTQLTEYVKRWKRAGPLLAKQREDDVQRSDTTRAFACFAGMPLFNLKRFPPEPTSGLVEQQRWFRKIAGR